MPAYNIRREGDRIATTTPYHPVFRDNARALNGKWDSYRKVWTFDARDIERVEKLCKDVYGDPDAPTTDVKVRLDGVIQGYTASFFMLGREIVSRTHRDYRVRLGDGVTVLDGAFDSRGGSMKNPAVGDVEGIVLLVRDVPKDKADAAKERYGDAVEIVAP